jgi:hypothetical protein
MQATTDWSKSVRVEVRGDDVVGHAGNVIPRMLVDNLGLTGGLCAHCVKPKPLRPAVPGGFTPRPLHYRCHACSF